jgi:hypothetical protein
MTNCGYAKNHRKNQEVRPLLVSILCPYSANCMHMLPLILWEWGSTLAIVTSSNKSKQNYPKYQMQMMLLKPVLCLYNNKKWSNHRKYNQLESSSVSMCWLSLVELCMSIQCRIYLQCSYLQIFFYYKSVFSQFRLGGSWKMFCKIRWALKFLSTIYILRWVTELIGQICDLPPAHPSSYFMTSPLFYHHRHRQQHHQHSAWYLGHQPCLPSWETRV